MIRQVLEAVYKRTVGALTNWFLGRFSSAKRGVGLLQLLYVVVVVGLMAGFINAVVFPVPNQTYIVYPSGGAQTVAEALIDSLVIAVGGAGIYMTYISGRQTTRARTVNLYLGLALLLIAVSVLTGIEIAVLKGLG
jgi:hypothetical protein